MKDKEYTHLMDAIELIHIENKTIMKTIVCVLLDGDNKKEILSLVDKWDKEFDNIRKHW